MNKNVMGKEKADDEISHEAIIKPICCSVGTFFGSNCCWFIFSLTMLLIGLLGLFLSTTKMVIFPTEVYITSLVFGGYTLLIIGMGILGTCARVELCFILYIFFAALGLLGQICAFAFLILYSNDIAAIKSLNSQIVEGNTFLEDHLAALTGDASDWITIQDKLDCCGIDFEVTFTDDDLRTAAETGARCDEVDIDGNLTEIQDDVAANAADQDFDEFGNVIEAIDNEFLGLETEFYCMSRISGIFEQVFPTVIVIAVLFLLLQLTALVSAGRMYWVPEFLGGWALDEEAETEIAEIKGIKFIAPNPGQGYQGGRVLSTIRNAGARMSYRLQNAVTADPRVAPNAGFMKRLSTNRAVSFVGRAPQPPGGPAENDPEPAQQRGFSVRSMLSVMSKGFGGQKSMIDTNAMGISQRSAPPGLNGGPGVPPAAQQAASNRNVEVNTNSKLLMSFVEEDERQPEDSLQI